MAQSNAKHNIPFLILGIAAALSGIFLTYQKQYMIGISSIIVGIGLAIRNYKEYKSKQE